MAITHNLTFVFTVTLLIICQCAPQRALAQPCVHKIGATLPLTGKLAFQGTAVRRGLELGFVDVNADGKFPCKFEPIFEDNAGDPKLAISSVNKLILGDHVEGILSDFTPMTQAIKQVVAREKIIMIYLATLPEIARENELFFMDYWLAQDAARLLMEYAERNRLSKLAFFGQQTEGCLIFEKALEEIGRELKISISAVETYVPGETDLRSRLLRIKRDLPMAILTCSWADNALLMKQMKELGMIGIQTLQMAAPFIPAGDTREMRKLYEENNTLSSWYGFADGSLSPKQMEFYQRFRAKYNEPPTPDSFIAYDDALVFATGVSAGSTCTNSNCKDSRVQAILALDLMGISGQLKFDPDGVAKREQFLIHAKGGVWEKLPGLN